MTTGVTASADLAIAKTGPATVVAGGGVSYQLVVTNNGPSDATSLSVIDTLPAGVVFVSATGTGWACSNAGQRVGDLHAADAGDRVRRRRRSRWW